MLVQEDVNGIGFIKYIDSNGNNIIKNINVINSIYKTKNRILFSFPDFGNQNYRDLLYENKDEKILENKYMELIKWLRNLPNENKVFEME